MLAKDLENWFTLYSWKIFPIFHFVSIQICVIILTELENVNPESKVNDIESWSNSLITSDTPAQMQIKWMESVTHTVLLYSMLNQVKQQMD